MFQYTDHTIGFLVASQYIVRLVQLPNALSPMLVTLLPIVTLSRLEHALNAEIPMLVTPSAILTLLIDSLYKNQGDSPQKI